MVPLLAVAARKLGASLAEFSEAVLAKVALLSDWSTSAALLEQMGYSEAHVNDDADAIDIATFSQLEFEMGEAAAPMLRLCSFVLHQPPPVHATVRDAYKSRNVVEARERLLLRQQDVRLSVRDASVDGNANSEAKARAQERTPTGQTPTKSPLSDSERFSQETIARNLAVSERDKARQCLADTIRSFERAIMASSGIEVDSDVGNVGTAVEIVGQEMKRKEMELGMLRRLVNEAQTIVDSIHDIDTVGRTITHNNPAGGPQTHPSTLCSALESFSRSLKLRSLLLETTPNARNLVDPAHTLAKFDPAKKFPAKIAIDCASSQMQSLSSDIEALSSAVVLLTKLQAEREDEEAAISSGYGDVDQRLKLAKRSCKSAQRKLEPALLEYKYAEEDGVQSEVLAASQSVSAAKSAMRSADVELSKAHTQLCAKLRMFPELVTLVPDCAPRELLPFFHPHRSLKQYSDLRPLGCSSRHAVRIGTIDGREVVVKEYNVTADVRKMCYHEAALLIRYCDT